MLGAWLEMRTMGQTRGALKELLDAAPATATVLRDGEAVEVLAQAVQLGATVLVKAGQRIPVDGEVTEGSAAVSEAAITGEPMPAERSEERSVGKECVSTCRSGWSASHKKKKKKNKK